MKILKRYTKKKSKAKKAVAMAKERAYDDLYARLETKKGEKELYRLARQRDRAGGMERIKKSIGSNLRLKVTS